MKTTRVVLTVVTAVTLASVSRLRAQLITGKIWENPGGPDATLANIPNTTPDFAFTFQGPNFRFDSRLNGHDSANYTVGSWLASGGVNNPLFNSSLVHKSDTMNNTILEFTGNITVSSGQSFTFTHDDGMLLTINGQAVINSVSPIPPTSDTGTYTGNAGTYAFTLIYAENNGAPAVLTGAVPEPTSMVVGALLLLPFGASTLRKFLKSPAA